MRLSKVFAFLIIFSILIQPLGYVPLTQENFVHYLQLTVSAGADVSSATLDMLGSVGILPWDYSVAELERIFGR